MLIFSFQTYQLYDPLVLDLNQDGKIETTSINQNKILFDSQNNNEKNLTGWISANDGFLVFDKNKNGLIDNQSEMFGNSNINGFEDLQRFDSNLDGKVDANDIDFAKLQIWQDLNQNGISEENELFYLKDLGISSINLNYQNVDQDLKNGNTISQIGSYTTENGKEHLVADVNFAFDDFIREKTNNNIEIQNLEDLLLPNVQAFGKVLDLRDYALQNQNFREKLKDYIHSNDRRSDLKELMQYWVLSANLNLNFNQNNIDNNQNNIIRDNIFNNLVKVETNGDILLTPSQINSLQSSQNYFLNHLDLNKFYILQAFGIVDKISIRNENDAIELNKLINEIYQDLFDYVYLTLESQILWNKYSHLVNIRIENDDIVLDMYNLSEYFLNRNNKIEALRELTHFIKYGFLNNQNIDLHLIDSLFLLIQETNQYDFAINAFSQKQFKNSPIFIGEKTGSYLNGKYLLGNNGDDRLSGTNGVDFLHGGDGKDTLVGQDGDDYLFGGNGMDDLQGGWGKDELNGGSGADKLYGGYGDDNYICDLGFGQDTISDHDGSNHLKFQNIAFDELIFAKQNNDILISHFDDSIRLEYANISNSYANFSLDFEDNSSINLLELINNNLII